MLSLCCQSRRSNSSKLAWRKFGSFSVHPLLPHVGRASGPHDKDGADVFPSSAALTEWFWSYAAHPERCVCALESSGITLREESWVQETLGHSIFFWAAVATYRNTRNAVGPCCLAGTQPCWQMSYTHRHSHRDTHMYKWISLVAAPALWCPAPLRPQDCPVADSDLWSLPQSAPRLLTNLHGLESTLTQGNTEEWSVTMADSSGQAQDVVAFICPPLLSFFPIICSPLLTLMCMFLLPLNIS